MALNQYLARLGQQLRQNVRLRFGLWIVLGLAWLYGLLLLRDEARVAATEHQTASKGVTRLVAQSNQTEWAARAEQAQSRLVELENRLWREGTIGLAQATFQDWLNQAAQQSNLARVAVTVAAQEDSQIEKNAGIRTSPGVNSDTWKVSAKVSFDFTPKALYAMMGRIEDHEKQITVETLVVRGPPTPRAEMVLVAYFQKVKPSEKVSETAPSLLVNPVSQPRPKR